MERTRATVSTIVRRILFGIGLFLLLLIVGVILCNAIVTVDTRRFVFRDLQDVPNRDLGVVLGTSKHAAPNTPNQYFHRRMVAAADLYHGGKIRHILVSGHRNSRYYDEPKDMLQALSALGVPNEAITQDQDGFRTLDSVVRADRVYGHRDYTVISDPTHIHRAVFLGRNFRQDIVGFSGASQDLRPSWRMRRRETFARVKAVLDVMFETQPKTLGEAEPIQVAAEDILERTDS
ncbi:MAG: ElyC/SanA/YdcF family protein [Verrucomicrobiota bacterium]